MTYAQDLKDLKKMLHDSEKHNPNGYSTKQVFQWMKLAYINGAKSEGTKK